MSGPDPTDTEASEAGGSGGARLLVFGALLLPYGLLVSRFDFVCDDAYISFRYARNLAEGLGLRFNVGVEPPVEGYTNLLWVLWCSVFEWLGVDVTVGARLTSVACGVLTLWWVLRFVEVRFRLSPWLAALPALVLATLPPFAVWSTGGLATLPFSFALFATFDALLRNPERPRWKQAAAWGVLTAGLRADGALFVGMVLAVAAARALRGRHPAGLRAAILAGLAVAAAVLLQLAFRVVYYGDLLPNTAYAKVGFSSLAIEQGRNYLVAMVLAFPAIGLIPLGALLEMVARRRWSSQALELLAPPVCIAAYVALVAGGDFMAMARLLVPCLAFLAALVALPLSGLEGSSALRRTLALGWPLLLIGVSLPAAFDRHPVPDSLRYALRFRAPIDVSEYEFWRRQRQRTQSWAVVGRALARYAEPGESLVGGPIGAIGYYSRLFIHDCYGLVNREVARLEFSDEELRRPWRPPGHHKRVPIEFFAEAKPTYMRVGLSATREGVQAPPGYRSISHELWREGAGPRDRFLVVVKRTEP